MFGLKDMTGAVMSPFDAFLMARGLKTLDIRMERHCANARKVADFFASHPAVAKVYYPGLDTFPGHEIAEKQMKLPGGMISIELKADRAAVAAALNKLQLCTIAVSLGDAETLVEHPATMTHSTYSAEELAAAGISEGLVRISVGLEDPEDIIDDFKAVLDTPVMLACGGRSDLSLQRGAAPLSSRTPPSSAPVSSLHGTGAGKGPRLPRRGPLLRQRRRTPHSRAPWDFPSHGALLFHRLSSLPV